MKASEAVKTRILTLLRQNNLSINKVCTNGNMTTSTLNSLLNNDKQFPSIKTIQKVCQGLGISLYDFFCDDIFKNIEYEE